MSENLNAKTSEKHLTSIGGQAVMEGVMMRGPKSIATAVRKSDGEIVVDKTSVNSIVSKYKLTKIPIVRGVVSFFDSMIIGVKSLMFSADQIELDDGEESMSKFEKWLNDKFGDKIKDIVIYFSVFVSLILGVGLFMLLPTILVGWMKHISQNQVFLSLMEGVVRIGIFLIYIWAVSKMDDIKRVFEYHGAEHKTIATYESGEELTVENARKYSRLHPRCGTSFLLIVMVVSIIFFSFLKWENVWQRLIYRLLLLPVVAGVSYELMKIAGKSNNKLVKLLIKPGLALQYLTTREPDDSQLEVAIVSIKNVLTGNKEDDKW